MLNPKVTFAQTHCAVIMVSMANALELMLASIQTVLTEFASFLTTQV